MLVAEAVGPAVAIDFEIAFSVGSRAEVEPDVGGHALELGMPLVVAEPEVGLVAEVVVGVFEELGAHGVPELDGAEGPPEGPGMAEVVEVPLVVEVDSVRNPLDNVGVAAADQVAIRVGGVVEGLLCIAEPNGQISVAQILDVGGHSLLDIRQPEHQGPLGLSRWRDPFEPTAGRVLAGEVVLVAPVGGGLLFLLQRRRV